MSVPLLIPDVDSDFPSLLLELTVAGVVYRFAELGPLDVADGTDVLHYHAGLVVSAVEESIDLWGTAASPRSVSVQVYLDGLVDAATLLSAGVGLYGASARLLLWDGGDYADCQVVASGPVVDPIYGDPDSPMSISFGVERDLTDTALIPSADSYLREDSLASLTTGQADDNDVGRVYPIIIGRPGYGPSPLGGRWKAIPTVRANIGGAAASDQRIIVAGHRVLATMIQIWNASNTSETLPVEHMTDDYGQIVAYVDTSAAGTPTAYTAQGTGPTHAAWIEQGHPGIDGAGLELLGDVVVWALEQTSIRDTGVDWERVHGNRATLNRLGRVATYIDERISPLEWLTGQVLSAFPVFFADSGSGIYVGRWVYDATPSDAVLTIDTSLPGYSRVAPVSWSGGGAVANDIIVEGGWSAASGSALTTRRWSGDPTVVAGDEDVRSHPLLSQSLSLFGVRELAVQVPVVEDKPTLDRIGAYLAYRHALPRAEVGYRIPWRRVVLDLGAVVVVEDAEVGLLSRLGIVTGRRYSGGSYEVRVSLLPVT